MAETHRILIVGRGGDGALARRLREVGFASIEAHGFEEAGRALTDQANAIGAATLSSALVDRGLKAGLKSLRRCARGPAPVFVAVGCQPDRAGCKRLRAAGVRLAAWEPLDPSTLRFQLNRALGGCGDGIVRRAARAPALLSARISSGGRSREARTYSLAEGGAFLETPRASLDNARVEVEIGLPGEPLVAWARVMFSNVPGNLQCARLPVGMGVRFEAMPEPAAARLRGYIQRRLSQLSI